jgi:aspartyl-tRNA(Asn)/glutamyl-tRNA(Gln) amidotransferase subunit A
MLAAYDRAVECLAGLGAEVVDLRLPFRFAELNALQAISQAESYHFNGRLAEDPEAPLDDAVRKRVLAGAKISASEYLGAKRLLREFKQKLYAAMDGVDALLTPTTETAAIPLDEVDQELAPSRFTRFGNLLELCALALPSGFTATGLPLSLQIVCRGYDEAMALRIGHAYQQATDWHSRLPPIGS